MNKLKILNTVALLVVVATPISQASVFDDIRESSRNLYETTLAIADQRDEAVEQRDEALDLRNKLWFLLQEKDKHIEKMTKLLEEQKELIDNYIFNRGHDK